MVEGRSSSFLDREVSSPPPFHYDVSIQEQTETTTLLSGPDSPQKVRKFGILHSCIQSSTISCLINGLWLKLRPFHKCYSPITILTNRWPSAKEAFIQHILHIFVEAQSPRYGTQYLKSCDNFLFEIYLKSILLFYPYISYFQRKSHSLDFYGYNSFLKHLEIDCQSCFLQ